LYSPVIDTSAEGYGKVLIGERWRELSPVHHVHAGLPPTIVFHGKRDNTTPFAGAKAFYDRMLNAGNRCELVESERGGHSYMMRTAELFDEAMRRTRKFLAAQGINDPSAPTAPPDAGASSTTTATPPAKPK
jgi:acetyl esterase